MARYVFRLEKFRITNTRALDEDTDHVSFSLKVGDKEFGPVFRHYPEVDNGEHPIDLELGPVPVDTPATPVLVNYQIINSGHGSNSFIEEALTKGAHALAERLLKSDDIWSQAAGAVLELLAQLDIFVVNCDGPVAVDQIQLTGADLENLTAHGTHRFPEKFYPGTDSDTFCGSNSKYYVTWSVSRAPAWQHNNPGIEAGGAPTAVGNPCGFSLGETQHVFYRAGDGHIHELFWAGGRWHHNDPVVEAGGAPTAVGNPCGFSLGETQHVFYRAGDGHIHELFWAGHWQHQDTTAMTGAPPAAGDPHAYVLSSLKEQHVEYRGTDGHIHELWWSAAHGWQHQDTTAMSGAPPAAGDPYGYEFPALNEQHVEYRGTDGHIHELWWSAAHGWQHQDTTAMSGAPPAAGDPHAYVLSSLKEQHVEYRGTDGHIHELWWSAAHGWQHQDTTAMTGAPPAAGDPCGFSLGETQHVFYRVSDGHIHELWWSAAHGWHHNDPVVEAGGAPAAAGDPCGFSLGGTQHVFYRVSDGHIHELFWA